MDPSLDAALSIGVAALGGAAVGIERQWSGHASGPRAHFAGLRTFTLLGAVGGLAGWLARSPAAPIGVALVVAAIGLVVLAYGAVRGRDIDATTEIAALVVLGAGVLDGLGQRAAASAIIAVTWLLLVEKTRLHRLARRIEDVEMRAAARFAVLAVVVLPLLPAGPLLGVRPRQLWVFVLLMSGISFAGFVAARAIGPRRGHLVTGLVGGLVSSTGVTLAFARISRRQPALGPSLAAGTLAACGVMFARLLVLGTILVPALGLPLARGLGPPLAIAAVAAWLAHRRAPDGDGHAPPGERNPLQLGAALRLAVALQAVLLATHALRVRFGDVGLLAVAALVGAVEPDAVTLAVLETDRSGASQASAATALAVAGLANTTLKLIAAAATGRGTYRRRVAAGLLTATVAGVTGLVVGGTGSQP